MEPKKRGFRDIFGFDELFGFDEIFQGLMECVRQALESGEFGEEDSLIIPFEGPNYKGFVRYEYHSNIPRSEQNTDSGEPVFFEKQEFVPRTRREGRIDTPPVVHAQNAGREALVDVIENPDELLVVVEVPARSRDDIKLNLTERNLEIRVDSPVMFYKVIELPCEVDCDSAKADFRNRILEIRIKKKH
ncbi:MAG: Hsp20/alpha crystallin family protein [Candidatus Freyarchaeota archaeon]